MKEKIDVTEILKRYENVNPYHVLLTPVQAGTVIGGDEKPIKIETLSNWRANKRYELSFIKSGRYVRYRLSDCLAFIESREVN